MKYFLQECTGTRVYVRAMEYATKNLPLNDELLKNARFLDFHSRESASISQVEYFVNR